MRVRHFLRKIFFSAAEGTSGRIHDLRNSRSFLLSTLRGTSAGPSLPLIRRLTVVSVLETTTASRVLPFVSVKVRYSSAWAEPSPAVTTRTASRRASALPESGIVSFI